MPIYHKANQSRRKNAKSFSFATKFFCFRFCFRVVFIHSIFRNISFMLYTFVYGVYMYIYLAMLCVGQLNEL